MASLQPKIRYLRTPAVMLVLMGLVSALYATAGQAGGSGFVAVMTFAAFPPAQIRVTAFALNVIAASYSVWRFHRAQLLDWVLLRDVLTTSLPAAFLGGLVALNGKMYFILTASLLVLVSSLMLSGKPSRGDASVSRPQAWMAGAFTGLASGLTGVGGGVFLSALLILFSGVSPKRTAALSPPFILINSAVSLSGAFLAGARLPLATAWFALAAILGSAVGTAVGLRWMSAAAIRRVLAAILLVAATQMAYRALT